MAQCSPCRCSAATAWTASSRGASDTAIAPAGWPPTATHATVTPARKHRRLATLDFLRFAHAANTGGFWKLPNCVLRVGLRAPQQHALCPPRGVGCQHFGRQRLPASGSAELVQVADSNAEPIHHCRDALEAHGFNQKRSCQSCSHCAADCSAALANLIASVLVMEVMQYLEAMCQLRHCCRTCQIYQQCLARSRCLRRAVASPPRRGRQRAAWTRHTAHQAGQLDAVGDRGQQRDPAAGGQTHDRGRQGMRTATLDAGG